MIFSLFYWCVSSGFLDLVVFWMVLELGGGLGRCWLGASVVVRARDGLGWWWFRAGAGGVWGGLGAECGVRVLVIVSGILGAFLVFSGV